MYLTYLTYWIKMSKEIQFHLQSIIQSWSLYSLLCIFSANEYSIYVTIDNLIMRRYNIDATLLCEIHVF